MRISNNNLLPKTRSTSLKKLYHYLAMREEWARERERERLNDKSNNRHLPLFSPSSPP